MKERFRKLLDFGRWAMLPLTAVFLLAFAGKAGMEFQVRELKITVDNASTGLYFMTERDVRDLLNSKAIIVEGTLASQIDVARIEELFRNDPYVKNAEAYLSIDGVLNIDVSQRIPLLRVFTMGGKSFYLDADGNKMPVSDQFTARVITASGFLGEEVSPGEAHPNLTDSLLLLAKAIMENDFMSAQTEQIFVNEEKEFEICPKVGRHIIRMGSATDLEEKFSKLILFYRKAMVSSRWEEYRILDLRFRDQVVCSRNPINPHTLR